MHFECFSHHAYKFFLYYAGAAKLGLQPGMITAVDEADDTAIDGLDMLHEMNVRTVILLQQGHTWVHVFQYQPEESSSEQSDNYDRSHTIAR